MAVIALASRQFLLLWLPLQFAGLGLILHYGMKRWEGDLRALFIERERVEGELNAAANDNFLLKQTQEGLREWLRRYQLLRQAANDFNAILVLDELIRHIVQAMGELIQKADLVLLYLVDPATLTLELKSVWRHVGNVTIKAKTGDAFDSWVMRQAQPLLIQDAAEDFRFSQAAAENLGRPLESLLAVPLMSEHRFVGVLRVESAAARQLGPDELRLTKIVGDLASLGIENSRLYGRMAELAITDDLTGLAVHDHFQRRLVEEIARARGFHIPISILLIDIDRFKVYNDTFGHSAGDKLLRQIADLLRQMTRAGEMTARLGGEEFAMLLPGVELEEAVHRAEKLRLQVASTQVELRRAVTSATISIGAASFPQDGMKAEQLLQAADQRLYRAKAQGRNRVCAS